MDPVNNKAVVLMNLGSPDSPEKADVRRYLAEFLMDRRVIDYPFLLRYLLVKGIIVPFRASKSAEAYKSIWWEEGSPLLVWTHRLRKALQSQVSFPVEVAMRYGDPTIQTAFEQLLAISGDLEEVLLIPMYPHYAMSSYETAVEYVRDIHRKNHYSFRLTVLPPYYDNPLYIEALAASMSPYLKEAFDHLLFSYHGVPKRHILKGDITGRHCLQIPDCCSSPSQAHRQCYRHQCLTTTIRVSEKLGIPKEKYSISFQSRLGREEWLQPYTAERLARLPGEGVKKILVVCPAFVSDCLETLEEIEKEGEAVFREAGGESFKMISCLNAHPAWVHALSEWIKRELEQ